MTLPNFKLKPWERLNFSPAFDYGVLNAIGINPGAPIVGAILASADTIAPTHGIHHISGTDSIETITVPYTGFVGRITFIFDSTASFATGGNIASAVTGVANQACDMVYDGVLWYPKIVD